MRRNKPPSKSRVPKSPPAKGATSKEVKRIKKKKLPSTLRLPTETVKANLIEDSRRNTKDLMCVIAKSAEDVENKERLADYCLFILNILDIEDEKLSFEKIKLKKPQRARNTVP